MARWGSLARRQKVKVAEGIEQVAGQPVPFEVWEELRRDTRFSLTQRKAIVRMPAMLSKSAKDEQLVRFRGWLHEAMNRRPDLLEAHSSNEFKHGDTWWLGEIGFTLRIDMLRRKTAAGEIIDVPVAKNVKLAWLRMPNHLSERELMPVIERLLYRLAAKQAMPRVEALLDEVNDEHFQVDVGNIKLSATTSRWGSCSTKGNINLSSRLLGAPEICLRAVIVHELAHRIEMNHSDRFWKLVYDAMPEYDKAHNWLKQNGGKVGWRKG